jgi:hypothetical protein
LNNLKISFAYPGVAYDPHKGKFYKLKVQDQGEVRVDREITPDENLNIIYTCFYSGRCIKKRAGILAWEILNGKIPDDCTLLFKNLDREDFRADNLMIIKKSQYSDIKDHLDNANGAVKIVAHPTNAYQHVVCFKNGHKTVKRTFHDISGALNFRKALILQANKILGKYLTSA